MSSALLCAALTACDKGDSADGGDAPGPVVGDYTDAWGGTHTVTAESWVAAFPPDTDGFVYTATCLISQMNENEGFLVCENDGQSTWSRYDWMRTGDTLYYCQIEFAAAEEDTAAANDSADRSDVEAGCSGYAWTLLTPAD